jgi:hypothetical protein
LESEVSFAPATGAGCLAGLTVNTARASQLAGPAANATGANELASPAANWASPASGTATANQLAESSCSAFTLIAL